MRLIIRALVVFSMLCLTGLPVLAQGPQCEKAIKAADVSGIERYCVYLKVSDNMVWKAGYYRFLGSAQFQKSGFSPASPLFGKALENVSTAIAIGAKSPDATAYTLRGLIYLQNKPAGEVISKDADKAVKDFTMAISLKPRDAQNYLHRGYAYNQLLKPDAAWADFQKARTLDPSDRAIQSAWEKQRKITPEGQAEIRRKLGVEPEAPRKLGVERDGEVGTCTGRISKIEKEKDGNTRIVVRESQTCTNTEEINLGSRPPPPECVVGATVTAKGTFDESLFFGIPMDKFGLESVTEIACR